MKRIFLIFSVSIIYFFTLSNYSVSAQNTRSFSQKQKNAKFIIQDKGEDKDGIPHSAIYVCCKNKKVFIMNVVGKGYIIEKSASEEMQIQKTALEVCSTRYAGLGDYFYIIPYKKNIQVFHGWIEENTAEEREKGGSDSRYHWKKIKEIPFQ